MATTPFQNFLNLIKFDQRFHQLNAQLHTYQTDVSRLENELNKINISEQELSHVLHDARKLANEHELSMKELAETEKNKKERLERITSQKEYAALKHEISQIQQQQQEYEKILLDAWNKVDNVQKEIQLQQEKWQEKRTELSGKREEVAQKITEIKNQIQQFEKERESFIQHVPEEWIEKYNMMRERVIDPVVTVAHGSCGACFYAIPSQMIAALKKGKLIQCKDCYRLLYMEPEESSE